MIRKIYWSTFIFIDSLLKFPNLKDRETGIQLGFDMADPVTSDLFTMHKRVSSEGEIIGIDPDPTNHQIAQEIITKKKLNIYLIQKRNIFKKRHCSVFNWRKK